MNLFLFYSLLSVIYDPSHPDPPFNVCDTPKFADNSPYRASLDSLLSNLPSTATPVSRFHSLSAGADSSRVYGLFLCYKYSPEIECQKCLRTYLPKDIHKRCMYKYEAVVWEEHCLFRYSTRTLYGQLNVTENVALDNKENVSEPQKFRALVNDTLHNLTTFAAFDPSSDMYSSGEKAFTEENTTLYAFVQCSQDLSPSDCGTCLQAAIRDILGCCYFSRGARLLSRSCFLRYELYPFTGGAAGMPKNGNQIEKWMIAAIAFGSGILVLSALGFCVLYIVPRNRTMRESKSTSGDLEMKMQDRDNLDLSDYSSGQKNNLDPQEYPFIEMEVIQEATDNFAAFNKLGEGGFGSVFKGILPDGQEIAVKRLSSNSEQGSDEFINEVLLIHKLQHVNLVKLLGFCVHEEEKLLVYEYMPNSSLDVFLCDSRKRAQLNWSTRLNIIIGIARGMLYLHQDSRLKIIHRDLKPSNVLLDARMNPKISDFGMARIFGGNDGEANTAKIVGTFGYMAPEFAMEGFYSIKSDVFSFGVVLLEIITGKKNAGFHLTKLAPSLLAYVWQIWNEGDWLTLMDPLLADSCSEEEFLRYLHVGLLCVQEDAYDRPSMSSVVVLLTGNSVDLSQPEQPAFTVGKFTDHYETCFNNLSLNDLTISDLLPR